MAAMLKSAAVTAVNKGHPSSFYNDDQNNPVIQALEQEINSYKVFMKKRQSPGYKPATDEASSRHSDALFELWNKYEPRLSKFLYQRRLLEMGDFLVSIQEYNLALWQCFTRYLKSFGELNVEELSDVKSFKSTYFPEGFETEDAGFTFRALMGKSICSYQVIKMTDPKLQNVESVEKSMNILGFLRLITQVILPKESLCWLVYNGTIHIYSISRHLMSLGHSAKVLEFVLWASMCMESSVPLLAVKYLPWRSTLYTAVCQCYYDCKAGQHAEGFARRALSKINELSQLENMSNAPENKSVESSFRHATIKMAIMIFKRTAFETRRKPKGLLRPKTRANLKDAAQLPWPRTQSERLLSDMFEGSSAQMLCLLESLTDSNRRTMISSPPAADNEVEILDVFAELFMSCVELIAGGGGTLNPSDQQSFSVPGMGGIVKEKPLINMAVKGEDGVPLSVVVRIVKLAYCYEQWDTFDNLLEKTVAAIKETNNPQYGPLDQELEVLSAYDKCIPRAKHRKLYQNNVDDEDDVEGGVGVDAPSALPLPTPKKEARESKAPSTSERSGHDDFIHLAEVLLSVVTGPFSQQDVDIDMIVDACLLLWGRCKTVFQKFQTGSTDNPKYLQKMENPSKWVYILDIVHKVLGWCGLSAVDPALTAEVVLRLSLVFEASAALEASKEAKKSAKTTTTRSKDFEENSIISSFKVEQHSTSRRDSAVSSETSRTASQLGGGSASRQSVFTATMLSQSVREQLLQARDILETGLQNVSYARKVVALTDGKSIADVSWVKDLNKELFEPQSAADEREYIVTEPTDEEKEMEPMADKQEDATAVWNMIKDLHLELIFMYHRVCLKLSTIGPDPNVKKTNKPFKRTTCSAIPHGSSERIHPAYIETFEELGNLCHRNSLSKALLYMQKALMSSNSGLPTKQQRKLLEDALDLIKKAEVEERRLYTDNILSASCGTHVVGKTKVPPAPILLSRTDVSMVFKPDDFSPSSGEKVAWYRLFARNAAGPNVKVRLNDYNLPETGEEVPSFRCELKASGLTPGEKYVFAVAAYTAEGKLIGGSIGETTKPILASHPLPILLSWAYLSQMAYQVGFHDISTEACLVLWEHFVAKPPPPENITYITSTQKDFTLTLNRLNFRVVSIASPVLLRMFLASIFINVDIKVKEGQLFCDTLCDKGPLRKGQINRLHQCEKMLVAMELAGWLNEANQALQSVVQCYGLLAPLIHFKIPATPIVQVLERCNAVLQETPVHLRQKRAPNIADSLHHMTACMTYHLAKVLRTWGQRSLAGNFNDTGRKLLAFEGEKEPTKHAALQGEGEAADPGVTDTGSLTLAALKRKKAKKVVAQPKEELEMLGNEQLKALEAHMLRLSKQAQGEHELTGNEDPSILHAYIAYLPSRLAYKEVVKFKRRAKYLEFFVQCAQKALSEGISDLALDWCDETVHWLAKRNEAILGGTKGSIGKQPGATTIMGDDPKKFAAALVEYSKDKDQSPRAKEVKKPKTQQKAKKIKYKAIGITQHMNDNQKKAQEELELKALDILQLYFVDMYHSGHKRRKMRKISTEEMPWRSQLNIVQGLSQFGVFLTKLEIREKMIGGAANYLYRTSFLDQEWFPFETAGTLVVGWSGGPSRLQTRQGSRPSGEAGSPVKLEQKQSGIEMAAAAATGKVPPPMYPIPAEEDEDTPRTYRSDLPTGRQEKSKKSKVPLKERSEEEQESVLMSKDEAVKILKKTMDYLKRAVVLAHRGRHWTLLQNACRAMWNCAHTALMRAHSPDKDGQSFLEVDTLRSIMWQPFCMAAECLLDMLVQLQFEADRRQKKKKGHHREHDHGVKSWMGDITNEKGGASLKFETPLDDISSVDTRWLKRIVLRVLELLYYEQKWERLVDIALRFNAISDDRFTEQVNPLLIQAQRKLVARITQYDGVLPPQQHFQKAQLGRRGFLTAKEYTTLQLRVKVEKDDISEVNPGAHIDPAGHDAYSGGLHALRLCCVPLDVDYSLQTLRQALTKTQYTSRALQHSRRLLILFLAGQMSVNEDGGMTSQAQSHVDFIPTTAKPQPTMPVDLSKEDFLSVDDVQTSPLPRGQIGVVMSSYDKTIEMLLAANHKGLAAEAMRELGNLHYHSGNIRGAYKWWSESLDLLLGTTDAIHGWRNLTKNIDDFSQTLIDKCGLWGCLIGGVLCSNIAQYILTGDLGLRTECCFLSGFFFKALFRSSLPHPKADRDYALYEVGEGCEVTNLVPGVDLLSERFRSDGRTLVAALRFVMDELARGRHNLFVLPLLTLYQFFTTFVCRDLQRSVDGRILKVRILTDLALFDEAFVTLQRLLNGERLPHSADSNFRQVESKPSPAMFVSSMPVTDPANLKALEAVIDKRLSSSLGTLYGPHLTCHLSLVQAHLFSSLADTMPVMPKFDNAGQPGASTYAQPQTISTMSHGQDKKFGKPNSQASGKAGKVGKDGKPERRVSREKKISKTDTTDSGADLAQDGGDESDLSGVRNKRFTDGKNNVSLEAIKGTLLAIADQILVTVSDIIVDNAEQSEKGIDSMSAAELEIVIACKLAMASISRQKHHSAMAARIIHSALTMIQGSDLFREKKEYLRPRRTSAIRRQQLRQSRDHSPVKLVEPSETSQFEYQNFQSRSRLDARLWLQCRLDLVKSMVGEIKGMGLVKGLEKPVKAELANVRQYCAEGVVEAETCGDVEMQAEFLLQGVLLNMLDGVSMEDTYAILCDILHLLNNVTQRSTPAELLRTVTIIHMVDMEAICPELDTATLEARAVVDITKKKYMLAQGWLLEQLEQLGEKIERRYDGNSEFSTPVSPLNNLYVPQLVHLVQVKLRIGHAMSRQAMQDIKEDIVEPSQAWAKALGVLNTGYQLSTAIAMRVANVEAELLLNLGKVQRQLFHLGKYQSKAVAQTFIEAIKTSYANDHDLSLIRQAYLEIAVLYLARSGLIRLKDSYILEPVQDSEEESQITKDSKKKKKKPELQIQSVIHKRGRNTDRASKSAKSKKDRSVTKDGESSPPPTPNPPTTPSISATKVGRSPWSGKSNKTNVSIQTPEPPSTPKPKRNASKDSAKSKKATFEEEKKAAWAAIRCATAIGQAQRTRLLLTGDSSVTSQTIGDGGVDGLPDFVAMDLVSSYVLGEKKRVYKNEIEEELAPLTEALEPPRVETYDDQLNQAKEATKDLSWIHILGYQGIIQRLCNTSMLTSKRKEDTESDPNAGDLGSRFDLGFISHTQFEIRQNLDVVRSVLFNVPWAMRLNYLHQYLSAKLPVYAKDCTAIYPPSVLDLTPDSDTPPTDVELITKSYEANKSVPIDIAPDGTKLDSPVAPGTQESFQKPSDKSVVSVSDNDMCLQWYQPSLDEYVTTTLAPDGSKRTDSQVMVLYALSKKPERTQAAMAWVSLTELVDLHDRLAVLVQRGEISLADDKKTKKETTNVAEKKVPRKGTRIKALSPKLKRDETLETLLRQCMADTQRLFGFNPEAEEGESLDREDSTAGATTVTASTAGTEDESKIPFEVSKANMHHFEKLCDPCYGGSLKEAKMLAWFMQMYA